MSPCNPQITTQWATQHYHSHRDDTVGDVLGCFGLARILNKRDKHELKGDSKPSHT